jgi:hypothetical protein
MPVDNSASDADPDIYMLISEPPCRSSSSMPARAPEDKQFIAGRTAGCIPAIPAFGVGIDPCPALSRPIPSAESIRTTVRQACTDLPSKAAPRA